MNSRAARFSTRRHDRGAPRFQADFDPKYRHTQVRYLGTGGTDAAADTDTVPAKHFIFSTVTIPAGHEGPLYLRTGVKEVFFIIRDKLKLALKKDGERHETILTDRDLVLVPPDVYREEVNIDDEDALMCVMLGARKLIAPTYPPKRPLTRIKC